MDLVTITVASCIPLLSSKLRKTPPLSTDNVIVFPLYHLDKKFSRTIYSPEMTDGKVSSEEIDKALTTCGQNIPILISPTISIFGPYDSKYKIHCLLSNFIGEKCLRTTLFGTCR